MTTGASLTPSLSQVPLSPYATPLASTASKSETLEKTHIAAFLTKAMMNLENRMERTLEEAVIEKLFLLLKEIPSPSHEELKAFFTLVLGLQKEPFEKELFKTNLLILSRKEKLELPLAALCIVANSRSFFSTPLGEIFSVGFTPNREKGKEFAEVLVQCFSYLDQLLQPFVNELQQFRTGSEKAIKKVQPQVVLSPQMRMPSQQKIIKKIKKSGSAVIENFYAPSKETVQQLLKSIQGFEMRTRKVGRSLTFFNRDSFNLSVVPLRQLFSYQQALHQHFNDLITLLEQKRIEISNCRIINAASMPKTTGTRIIDGKGYENALRALFKRESDTPETEFNEELDRLRRSFPREEIPPDKNGSVYFLALQEQQSTENRYTAMKEQATILRDIHQQMFSFLLGKLENLKKHLPIQEEASWLFLEDWEEEFIPVKKTLSKKPLPPIPALDIKASSTPAETIFHTSFLLTKEVKKNLLEELESSTRAAVTYEKAFKAIKELGDHIYYGALNFQLFIQMLMEGDLFGLNVIVPLLFLDLHIQLEQRIKYKLILRDGQYPKTHSLVSLSRDAAMPDEMLLHNFNLAMIHARYPLASKDHYIIPPKELEWILFCSSLNSEGKVLDGKIIEQLKRLITFVFSSYEETLKFISRKNDLEKPLETCKNELFQKMDSLLGKPIQECKKGKNPPSPLSDMSEKLRSQECSAPIHQVLLETSDHLAQIASASYLARNYPDPLFSPIHERNQLLYNWVFEKLFVAQGLAKGLGDLRWIRHHDLLSYYYMVHPEDFAPHDARLDSFNFGRTLHYGRDKPDEDLLPFIKSLLRNLKSSKKEVKQKLFKLPPIKRTTSAPDIALKPQILAEELLQNLVKETLTTIQ